MQIKLKLLMVAMAAMSQTAASGAVSAVHGDLVAAFYKVNGSSVEANTYVINLGPAASLREGTMNVSYNIGSDLATAFGSDWASSNTVRWSILGVVGPTTPLTAGDPSRTTYFSLDNGGSLGSSTSFNLSSGNRGTLSTQLSSFFSPLVIGIAENGAVEGGAIYPSTAPSSLSSFLPPTQTTNFGISLAPYTTLNGADAGLDVYRMLHSTSGADLAAAASPGNAVVGAAQYVGGFSLSTTGVLSSVPEPATSAFALLSLPLLLLRRQSA